MPREDSATPDHPPPTSTASSRVVDNVKYVSESSVLLIVFIVGSFTEQSLSGSIQ